MGLRGVILILAGGLCSLLAHAQPLTATSASSASAGGALYTARELAWMRAHPVVRYSIDPYWPMEYLDKNGQHRGLTREYIDHIARVTGLVFERVDSPDFQHSLQMIERGELDAVSAVSVRLLDDQTRHKLLISDPYFVGASVIITKAASPITYNPAKLEGQVVAVKGGGGYERYLSQHYPGIHLLLLNDPEAALAAVDDGSADAVIGLDQALRPLVRRKYLEQLHLSGVISDMPAVIAMGLAPGNPMLKQVIDKALGALTSRDTDLMDQRWIAQSEFGAPSWRTLVKYYRWELLGLAVCVLLLVVFSRHAMHARRAAQRSEGVKAAFLAMMSHEIRTPMNAIVSSLELLKRTPLQAAQDQLATLASNAAGNLLELLDNVLDLSRLEARRVELDPQPTDLWALVRAVADIHRLAAQAKGVALHVHERGQGAQVMVDAVRLRQILSNLLSNAVKFTDQGQVDLYVALEDGDPGMLRLEVSDTGIGIAPERQAQLFQPFVQSDNSTTRRYGGSGLGLAICKDLAALMGGDIGLRSQPGQGTTVWARLPVGRVDQAQACAPQPAASVPVEANAGEPPCLLLVEDHPVNQKAITLQLEALGYRCELAKDGLEGLARLERRDGIAAVLLDCQLPGMDGYEVARRIREQERQQGLPRLALLAISAANDEAHQERVFASDMDATLSKPLRLAQLQALLGLWVGPANGAAQGPEARLQTLFVSSTEADLLEIQAALREGDLTAVAHRAHRIKGAALMVGAAQVAALAGALEAQLGERPPRVPCARQVQGLRGALERLK